jgi:hypothetical protein
VGHTFRAQVTEVELTHKFAGAGPKIPALRFILIGSAAEEVDNTPLWINSDAYSKLVHEDNIKIKAAAAAAKVDADAKASEVEVVVDGDEDVSTFSGSGCGARGSKIFGYFKEREWPSTPMTASSAS